MGGIISLVIAAIVTVLLASSMVAGAIESSDFDDPTVCKGCHAEIYNQWDGSMHSIAYTDPVYLKEEEMASRETDGLTDTYCARCHTPIGVLSGEVPPIGLENLSEISKKGIQCDFCHSVDKSTGIGNGAFMVSPDGIKRGPYDDSKSPYHESVFSDLHTKSEFCGMCHNVNHPVTGIPIEETYTEWKEGPYNTGEPETTTHCQDCHMTPGITHFEANPGKASGIGPERDHVYTHHFVGGNAVVTGVIGSEVHQRMAEERLKSAATLELEAEKKDNEAEITVKVTNIGAGHKLPTGLTEAREAWIEILAKDASGKGIFHTGGLDSEGAVDHDAVMYHAVLADASGKPTIKVWEAESLLSDNRILPKETRVEKYNFAFSEDVMGPITVEAKLNYRSASQKLLDSIFGKGVVVAPVIEMASAEGTIEVGKEPGEGVSGFEVLFALISLLVVAYLVKRRLK
ncbi:MAG: multiheme c-type cytochrome [Halobacteriota archaeon]